MNMQQIQRPPVPVTLLSGFLGSGKSTLLNHILTANHGKKIAVIENEYGQVGIDKDLLTNSTKIKTEAFVEMENGCLCCTVRGDLMDALEKLGKSGKVLDHLIVEPTGMADPAPIAQTFLHPVIRQFFTLDAIVCLVDSKHVTMHLNKKVSKENPNEAVAQIAFADRILLNKVDLVKKEDLVTLKKRLTDINQAADMIETQLNSQAIDMGLVLNLQKFSPSKITISDDEIQGKKHEHHHHDHDHDHKHHHDHDHEHQRDENSDHDHDHKHHHDHDHKHHHDHDHHHHHHHHPKHDDVVASQGFKFKGAFNLNSLREWLGVVSEKYGSDLYRYKGILNIIGFDRPYHLQGVHMLFEGTFGESEWKESKPEKRENRFVFIGKKLDEKNLEKGLKDCIQGPLRFKVGEKVMCAMSQGFTPGKIVKLFDNGNPYRVNLESGVDIWVPFDNEQFCRKGSVQYLD